MGTTKLLKTESSWAWGNFALSKIQSIERLRKLDLFWKWLHEKQNILEVLQNWD